MSSTTVHLYAASTSRSVTPRRSGRSHLRLTRRGRLVLMVGTVAPLIAAALWFSLNAGPASASYSTNAPVATFEHVTVGQGESLWQIAETVAPQSDPRQVVDAIMDLNGLQTSGLTPGQTLAIPAEYASSN